MGEEYPGNLPDWAQETLREIKKNAPEFLSGKDPLLEGELASFTNKEAIRTGLALGSEKLLQWLKQYAAILTLEENITVREFMTSWLGDELEEYQSKGLAVTSEEKEELMELILRQSELLMLYETFLKSGCTNLKESKVKERTKMPGVEGTTVRRGRYKASYDLPAWAREELNRVKLEKKLKTSDEEAGIYLVPLLRLPKHLRKEQTELFLERGKKKILKYLHLMKTLRSADIISPPSDLPKEITSEEMKSMILNNRTANMKKQFLNLFPDLGRNILDGGPQATGAETDGKESINDALLKMEEQKRLEDKIDLQDNILKMDKKLRAYEAYLKSTEEIIYTKDTFQLPTNDSQSKLMAVMIFVCSLLKSISEDRAAMVEEQNLIHIDYLLKVLDEIDYYTEAFTIYLYETQEESMVNMRSCLDIGQLVMAKEAEILKSQRILNIIKSYIYSLGGLLKFRRLCQTVLYELSPHVWREKYLLEKGKVKVEAGETADQILSHLAVFKSNTLVQEPRLDRLIVFLADTVRNLGPPANYLKSGFQIDLAVRHLELQNLHSFQHLALIVMRKEEQERAKQDLIRSCKCEINRMEAVIDEMRNQFHSKVKALKSIDERSANILDKYWRIVALNEPLSEATNLIKEMFHDFIGPSIHMIGGPLEMLEILTEDIVSTQMELCELPKKATEELRAFICEKEDMIRETLDRNQEDYVRTSALLKGMERTWGLSVAQQGHPPRYRSLPLQDKDEKELEEAVRGVRAKMIERMEAVFGDTGQRDALEDALAALELEEAGEERREL